eukprot:RCo045803
MWVVGGGDGLLSDVWSSPDGARWTQLLSQYRASFGGRQNPALVTFYGKLWFLGGDVMSSGAFADVWSSSDGVNWANQPGMPSTLTLFPAAVVGNTLYVTGGLSPCCYNPS